MWVDLEISSGNQAAIIGGEPIAKGRSFHTIFEVCIHDCDNRKKE